MCRNIKRLYNFEPPATPEEIQAASLQFIRKVSGYTKPSEANQAAFQLAVEDVSKVVQTLLNSLITNAAPLDREIEAQKNRARTAKRYGG
jgi:hypothetical protein